MAAVSGGEVFREAWIAGIRRHFPGTPKDSYVVPWAETPQWERDCATAVYEQVAGFIEVSAGATARLSREQRGHFIALCWIGQIYKHVSDPKPSYVADWDDLPEWQRETDSDIFDHIERRMNP